MSSIDDKIKRMVNETAHCRYDNRHRGEQDGVHYCEYHFPEERLPAYRCQHLREELVYIRKGVGMNQVKIPYYKCMK
jgi:hypothetical protein